MTRLTNRQAEALRRLSRGGIATTRVGEVGGYIPAHHVHETELYVFAPTMMSLRRRRLIKRSDCSGQKEWGRVLWVISEKGCKALGRHDEAQ